MTVKDFIMNKLILDKIKHLTKDKRYLFFKILQENEEVNEDLKFIRSSQHIGELFEKIIKKSDEKKESIKKILNDYKKELSLLKDKQDLIFIEKQILEKIKE